MSPKAIIFELQLVTIQDMVLPESATSHDVQNILDKVKMSDEITTEERERCRDLITEYSDIFSKRATDLGTTERVGHCIDLQDETPFKQKYRRIPPTMIEEVQKHIQELLASNTPLPFTILIECCIGQEA